MTWTPERLRNEWIQFFTGKKHSHLPSASLLPAGDPTLLFTSAGMVPFKSYFDGSRKPPAGRVVTIQKCLRTTDLESVGKTARHCTFFEMLGNFSFADYFKTEAIEWAYEFSVKNLKLDPDKIHVTVYEDDDEAIRIWNEKAGVPLEKITRLGKEHNWWGPAGNSGPCGPCSELYLDRGPEICHSDTGCKNPDHCKPGDDCDRFMEYWNLVFNQYNQDENGKLTDLPGTGIDTGAGLERIVAVLNGDDSVYETSELLKIQNKARELVKEITGKDPVESYAATAAFRVLTDHARSTVFAMADGILPDNTGRGYVIRRIIRRACLFAQDLGVKEPVLYRMVNTVREIYGSIYTEIEESAQSIEDKIHEEEKRFLVTLDTGLKKFDEFLAQQKEKKKGKLKTFSGKDAFMLYDTYGFPLEMTIELAEKHGLTTDQKEFDKEMSKQQEAARKAREKREIKISGEILKETGETAFLGYNKLRSKSTVIAVVKNGKSVQSADEGEALVITKETPFYPEGGGQLGDSGFIETENAVFEVHDTQKKGDTIIHAGTLKFGSLSKGDSVSLNVDEARRQSLTFHHSATHLLNKSLRDELGDHILQTGSLVAPDYLRFDFSHGNKIPHDQLIKIEQNVNRAIAAKAEVTTKVMPIEEAKKSGAVATFGEKYGEEVRVVSMGDGEYSIEFCGGCHVQNTGDIRLFHIIKESSPGAGNRRIEAIAGQRVADHFADRFAALEKSYQSLKSQIAEKKQKGSEKILPELHIPDAEETGKKLSNPVNGLPELEKLHHDISEKLKSAEKEWNKLIKRSEAASFDAEALAEKALASKQKTGNITTVRLFAGEANAAQLRELSDRIKEQLRDCLVLLGAVTEKGPMLVYSCTNSAVDAGIHCGKLVSATAPEIDGKGGGKPQMAQAGGSNPDGIEKALEKAFKEADSMLASGSSRS